MGETGRSFGWNEWLEAIQIFQRYLPDQKFPFSAEHDIIYGPDIPDIAQADRERMEALGWFHDDDVDCWAKFT